jgi:hypothetical protein
VLDNAADRRLAELSTFFVRVPFSFEQAERALQRVLDKVPPNGENNQQYKDTLIWGAVLLLAQDFDVILVTSDKAFYANREPSKGLAVKLLADVDAEELSVTAVGSLADAAEHLRLNEPPVDGAALTRLIEDAAMSDLSSVVENAEFLLGVVIQSKLRVFVTEDPDVVAVAFNITHAIEDLREPSRSDATASAEGDCLVRGDVIIELRPARASLEWTEPDGEPGHATTLYGRGTIHIGERHEPYTVRKEISSEGSK